MARSTPSAETVAGWSRAKAYFTPTFFVRWTSWSRLSNRACVLKLHEQPVTIRENEAAVAERVFLEGLITPIIPKQRTGKKIAVIGSGPAGLA